MGRYIQLQYEHRSQNSKARGISTYYKKGTHYLHTHPKPAALQKNKKIPSWRTLYSRIEHYSDY